jgi:EAL domain-containing protein (putative c-di-GMP-specific phosphodiesterase class I)
LCNIRNQGHAQLAAQKIQRQTKGHTGTGTVESWVKASIGIALGHAGNGGAHEVLRAAEIALLEGRRCQQAISFHGDQSDEELIDEWKLEQRLGDALENGLLELHYQPKYNLKKDAVTGAEALLRWQDPQHGPISPELFIGVAESCGLITDLTYFAVQRACRQLNLWTGAVDAFSVAVNLSPLIIRNLEIVDVVKSATRIWNVDPGALILEVTENAMMADPKTSRKVLTAIRDLGARVSVDDFGTGYSSFAYLKNIPADELKIDRSFVMNMLADDGDYKIVEHAISIAKSFGLTVVAEGVENAETLGALRLLGCDLAQGYHFCKALAPDDFLAWYQDQAGVHAQGANPDWDR